MTLDLTHLSAAARLQVFESSDARVRLVLVVAAGRDAHLFGESSKREGPIGGFRSSGGTMMTGACCSWATPSSRLRTWASAVRELCDDRLRLALSHDEPEQASANQRERARLGRCSGSIE